MRVTILGAGAIGGAIAHRLHAAGARTTILARPATAEAIAAHGLTLETPQGRETLPVPATSDAAALGPQDVIVGAMKAQDWPGALASIAPLLGAETLVVPAMNGIPWYYFDGVAGPLAGRPVRAVDPDGALLAAIPGSRIVGCVVYMASQRLAPEHVLWTSGNRLVIGRAHGPADGRVASLADLLVRAGFAAEAADDIRVEIFTKLLGNTSFNPLSVVTGATMDAMVGDPGLRDIAVRAMVEVKDVAAALGAPVPIDVEARLAMTKGMAGFKTSMLQDFEAGRPLELGAIVDAVVELADLVGVPVPTTRTLGDLARFASRGR